MKKINSILMVILFAVLLVNTGCKKEGCTDPDSINYDSEAKKDDGSCEYIASAVFWFNEATSDSLLAYDVTSFTIFVDDEEVGTLDVSDYLTGEPYCGQESAITVMKNLGSDKTRQSSYSVIDQDGYEILSGRVNFVANTCPAIQLVY